MNQRINADQARAIAAWLVSESARIFVGVAQANAERIEAEAVAKMMADPVAMIELERPTDQVHDLLRKAAMLRLFVRQFEELAGQDFTVLTYVRRDSESAAAGQPDTAPES